MRNQGVTGAAKDTTTQHSVLGPDGHVNESFRSCGPSSSIVHHITTACALAAAGHVKLRGNGAHFMVKAGGLQLHHAHTHALHVVCDFRRHRTRGGWATLEVVPAPR